MNRYFLLLCGLFFGLTVQLQAQNVIVDLVSPAASTIDVNYTATGSYPVDIWNNQVLTITWPDVGAGGPGNAVSISVVSSNSGWFFNLQGGVTCTNDVCSQKVISSSNNVTVNLLTTTNVVTLSVSGTGSDNTTYSVSGASGDLFVNHAIFGNVGVPGTSVTLMSVLPVELLTFEAALTPDQRVWLDWRTANEQNNDYFLIERSIDAQHFEPIAQVAGAGNSYDELQYESWDNNPRPGINYYRLKQVDFDGSFDYSDIRAVKLQAPKMELAVFPNPASHQLNIRFDESIATGTVQLFNGAGQLVREQRLEQQDQTQLPVHQLAEGMYWIRMEIDGQLYSRKVVIAKN
ncbi:MAG: T9SS type A sorting domain-containing protein [Bacteroidota bacterium]